MYCMCMSVLGIKRKMQFFYSLDVYTPQTKGASIRGISTNQLKGCKANAVCGTKLQDLLGQSNIFGLKKKKLNKQKR